jgi:hypothetical protein
MAATGSATEEQLQSRNNLDKQVNNIVLSAEKAICPRVPQSKWSAIMADQAILCKFWAVDLKGVRTQRTTIARYMNHYNKLPAPHRQTIDSVSSYRDPATLKRICRQQLRQATRYQNCLLKIHQQLRHQGLLSLKEIREKERNLTAAEIIGKIIQKEIHDQNIAIVHEINNPKGRIPVSKHQQYIKQWHRINPVFHPNQQSKLSTIEVPFLNTMTNQQTTQRRQQSGQQSQIHL